MHTQVVGHVVDLRCTCISRVAGDMDVEGHAR